MDDSAEALARLVAWCSCYRSWFHQLVLLLPLGLCLADCCLPRHPAQATQLLANVAHPERPQAVGATRRVPVSYRTQGRAHRGDLNHAAGSCSYQELQKKERTIRAW